MNPTKIRVAALLVLALALLVSCGDEPSTSTYGPAPTPNPSGLNVVDPSYAGRFQAAVTVLESPDHGPQLCDAVAESYPPQCGGPDIVGWDWSAVDGEDSASGTTWGTFIVTGTWDGERLTLTETPRADDGSRTPSSEGTDFTSPCPEPEGGWRPVDASKATDEASSEAFERASQSDDYAGGWLDQSYLDDLDATPGSQDFEDAANDPTRYVLNFRFTGNLAEHEREIREVWGGALCISAAAQTEAALNDVQQRIHGDYPEITSSGQDVVLNALVASTMVATTALQAELDGRYGDGVVILHGVLQPID